MRTSIEDVRLRGERALIAGRWHFPAGAPPHALAVLLPALEGGERLEPGPLAPAAAALACQGLAAFALTATSAGSAADLSAIWTRATRHPRISRHRTAAVAWGPMGPSALELGPPDAAAPRLVVLAAPSGALDLSRPREVALHLLFAGADREGLGDVARQEDLIQEARHAGLDVETTTLEEADGELRRPLLPPPAAPLPDPRLAEVLAGVLHRRLRPPWEAQPRRPGVAIGGAD